MDNKQSAKSLPKENNKKPGEASNNNSTIKPQIPKSKTSNNHTTLNPIISYAYSEEQNPKYNEYMEDISLIKPNFNNQAKNHLFGIFDGHGSSQCAKLSSELYPKILTACLKESPSDVGKSLCKSFDKLDQETMNHKCVEFGTTATIVYISGKLLYCANVGDSTCMIVSNDKVTIVSKDHKCTDQSEIKRVYSIGGRIEEDRVDGLLAITRAIGDHQLKNKGVICTPHIEKYLISANDRYCIIASDGVWDALKSDDLFTMSQTVKTAKDFVEKIVKTSVKLGSSDNISCLVIAFYE